MTKEQKACLIFGMSSEERIPEDLFDMRFKTVEFTDELAYSTS